MCERGTERRRRRATLARRQRSDAAATAADVRGRMRVPRRVTAAAARALRLDGGAGGFVDLATLSRFGLIAALAADAA